jgi:hypothetical protein
MARVPVSSLSTALVDNFIAGCDDARPVARAYAYELRSGELILSTGLLTAEQELAPGDEITLAGVVARVEELGWVNGEPRLMLQPVQATT